MIPLDNWSALLLACCIAQVLLIAFLWREVIAMNSENLCQADAHDRAVAHTNTVIANLRSNLTEARHKCWQADQKTHQANEVAQAAADACQSLVHEHARLIDALEEACQSIAHHLPADQYPFTAIGVAEWRTLIEECRAGIGPALGSTEQAASAPVAG